MHFFGYLPVCHEVKNLEAFQPVKDLEYAKTVDYGKNCKTLRNSELIYKKCQIYFVILHRLLFPEPSWRKETWTPYSVYA